MSWGQSAVEYIFKAVLRYINKQVNNSQNKEM